MPRLLLLLPATSYRIDAFLDAAHRAGAEVTVACDRVPALAKQRPSDLAAFEFARPERAARQAAAYALRHPFDAVLGVDDSSAVAAAAIAEALALPRRNPLQAAVKAGNKRLQRDALGAAGLPVPWHRAFRIDAEPSTAARDVVYPCVLKPLVLAASRGVIRADDPAAFVAAFERIARILHDPDVSSRGESAREILAEAFVPGFEVALEGLLVDARLHPLALFDKPDPLDGPFFEETIYVTPSRLPSERQRDVIDTIAQAAAALGLREGAVHAECRLPPAGGPPVVLEVAARSIGGLCARSLRFEEGATLEDLIVRHALGLPVESLARERAASGVMMIPTLRAGVLEKVRGREAARAVPLVEDVVIAAHPGMTLVPLPEGSRYLGFIFARGPAPEAVERALREAHARLDFEIA